VISDLHAFGGQKRPTGRPISLLLVAKHTHRHLPSFDSRASQDFQDTLRQPLRYIHEGEPFLDVNGADQIAADLGFVGDGANQITRPDARVPRTTDVALQV